MALAWVAVAAFGGCAAERACTEPATDETLLAIDVKAVAADAKPTRRKHPWQYEGFEKRAAEVEGKSVLDIMGSKLSIRLLDNGQKLNPNTADYGAADFVCAILRGRIVRHRDMKYHLQDAQECRVTTPAGEFGVGIYYPPVGYVVLPSGEAYWFLFEQASR